MSGLRYAALGLALLLAIVTMVWPFGWPKPSSARSQLSYFASLVFAIAVLILAPYGHGPTVPFFGTVALVAWVLLGALWLIRRNPQIPNPDWTRKPWSVADWGLIAIVVLSGLAATLG